MGIRTLRCGSLAQTEAFAASFAGDLAGGDLIILSGTLGSGKTQFVIALGLALGVVGEPPTSPTFDLVHSHKISPSPSTGSSIECLHHIDLFRLTDISDDDAAWLEEYYTTASPRAARQLTVIEWGERVIHRLERTYWHLTFSEVPTCEQAREITVQSP